MSAHYSDGEHIDLADLSSDDGDFYSSRSPAGIAGYTRPILGYLRSHNYLPANISESPGWKDVISTLVATPRFRRSVIVSLVLLGALGIWWKLVLSPRGLSTLNLNVNVNSMRPDLVHLDSLDPSLLPGDLEPAANAQSQRRLIFIGDVHGCKSELERLLEKVSFDTTRDHLVFAGDMINKGPDSPGVVDLARRYSASSVRGNHEDKVLALRHEMVADGTLSHASEDDSRERRLARQLTDEQVKWLDARPVILRVGQIHGMGEVVVVHGGLVAGIELEKQDPHSVMNMLTIDPETNIPSAKREGTNWTKSFNKHQSELFSSLEKTTTSNARFKTMTVIYGHDSKRSLSIADYTKGLDTGCVKGQKLTALVVEDGGKQSIVQVKCHDRK